MIVKKVTVEKVDNEYRVKWREVRRKNVLFLLHVELEWRLERPVEDRPPVEENRAMAVIAPDAMVDETYECDLVEILKDLLKEGVEPEKAVPRLKDFWLRAGSRGTALLLHYYEDVGIKTLEVDFIPW